MNIGGGGEKGWGDGVTTSESEWFVLSMQLWERGECYCHTKNLHCSM
jgi:hypothetical protein